MKKRVNITLEDEVIERVDRFAEQHYMSRSGAITMLIVEGTAPVRAEKSFGEGGKK
jgi:metal-responsive CopG/Arc/MetJ family transcriptional regulator